MSGEAQMFRGDRLKKIRLAKGLTQKELGAILGITKAAICFYERNKRTPSTENIIDFIQIFNVTADYLLGTDNRIKTVTDEAYEVIAMSEEEVKFIEELRKDKFVCDILFTDPKRGAELIKKKIG